MKTAIKYISIAAALISAAACEPNLDYLLPGSKIGFSTTDVVNEVCIFDEGYNLAIIKSGKATESATVKLAAGTYDDVKAYNAINDGSNLIVAPGSCFTLPSEMEFNFAAEDTRKVTRLSWDVNEFFKKNDGKDAVIPIKISESSIEVDSARIQVFVKPYIPRVGFDGKDIKNLYPNPDELKPTDSFSGSASISMDKVVNNRDIKISLALDNSVIAAENEARGKDYKQAPDGVLKLKSNEAIIKAGELYGSFDYEIDYGPLFDNNGKLKELKTAYLIPIKITSVSPNGVGLAEITTCFVVITISDSGIVTPPARPQEDLIGPWEVLDGAQFDMAHDPNCPDHSWYDMYNVNKLVDGNFHYYDGAMGVFFWTENVYPLHFVFDLGQEYIFGGFRLVDSKSHQNQFRHIQVYVAREYAGADTDWKLACEGTRTFAAGWQQYPADDGSQASLDAKFTYHMPEDSIADDPEVANEFNYTKGQYIKLVLVEPHWTTGDYTNGRGYLMEFYATGWSL